MLVITTISFGFVVYFKEKARKYWHFVGEMYSKDITEFKFNNYVRFLLNFY